MGMSGIGSGMTPQRIQHASSGDRASIERRLEQLKKQMQQVKENKQLSPEEKEKRIRELQKQIDDLQKQQAKASQTEKRQEASDVQAERVQELERVGENNQALAARDLPMEMKRRFDTFEHQEEGETAGLYEAVKDADGKRTIRVDGQPADKQTTGDTQTEQTEGREEPTVVVTTMDLSEVERDIKQLRQRQQQLEQRLGAAPEEQQKTLQRELTRVTQELARKDTDAYRNSHDNKRQYTLK